MWSHTQLRIPAQTRAAGLWKETPLARSGEGGMEGSAESGRRARVGKGSQIPPFSSPKEASVQEPEEHLGPRSQKKSLRSQEVGWQIGKERDRPTVVRAVGLSPDGNSLPRLPCRDCALSLPWRGCHPPTPPPDLPGAASITA